MLELLDHLDEQQLCADMQPVQPVLERLVWKQAVQVPSQQLGLGRRWEQHQRQYEEEGSELVVEGSEEGSEEGDEFEAAGPPSGLRSPDRPRVHFHSGALPLPEGGEAMLEEATRATPAPLLLQQPQQPQGTFMSGVREQSFRRTSPRPSSQTRRLQQQEWDRRSGPGVHSDYHHKAVRRVNSSAFLSDSQAPDLLHLEPRTSTPPLRHARSATRAQGLQGSMGRAGGAGYLLSLPATDPTAGGSGGIGGRHVASMLAQLSRVERSPLVTPTKGTTADSPL